MKRSSLLLAGGLGTRLSGSEKALLPLNDGTFIENTLKVLDSVSDEVIISFRDEKQLALFEKYVFGRKVAIDLLKNAGPLAGMIEGLKKASSEYVFVVACDMPYLNGKVVEMLFEVSEGHDAVIPVSSFGQKETLHAVYRRKPMLDAIEDSLGEGESSVMSSVSRLNDVLFLGSEQISKVDQGLMTFTNINTLRDVHTLNTGQEK